MPEHRVVLVRHGQSQWNVDGRWQGHGGTGLTALGHAQAARTAAHLALVEREVVGIVHSDLERAAETASAATGLFTAPAVSSAAWREIDIGWWSGLTHEEIAVEDPVGYRAWRTGQDSRKGGGETHAELRARVRGALDALADAHPPGTVLVFTHGGCVREAALEALAVPDGPNGRLGGVANCSLSVLAGDGGAWRLITYNATGHLDGAGPSSTREEGRLGSALDSPL